MINVYINKISKFFPNKGIDNDQMESILGKINDIASKSRRLVLRNNGILNRYYAIDADNNVTHSNAEMTYNAVDALFGDDFPKENLEVLSCGTSTPDQLIPSHAAMVHGLMGSHPVELNSSAGVCCSAMNALKYGVMSIKSGSSKNAICTGSERVSTWLKSTNFDNEIDKRKDLENNPSIAFEKDFLRWMLSDGASAVLLEDQPKGPQSLKVEWIESFSFANELETCMYAGAQKNPDGSISGWSEFNNEEINDKSIFSIKQDIKILNENILKKGVESIQLAFKKHGFSADEVDHLLPHLSSYYFKDKLYELMVQEGVDIPLEKWFTNLDQVGNVGSASSYLMLEELFYSGSLKKGEKIILSVPESGRFSYSYVLLTVV